MLSLRRLLSGVVIGWAATITSISIGLFMSPFLIHHLGLTSYGVWILVQSAVSYMYIMDLGLRSTVVRFSARAQARGDHAEVNRVVSAALWVRLWSAVAVLVLIAIAFVLLPHVLKIPTEYQSAARMALLLVGGTFACTLVFSVFASVLSGLGRFEVLGLLELAQITIIGLGTIPIVKAGYGFVAMAALQFITALAVNLVTMALCFHICPELSCRFSRPANEMLYSLWSLGFYILVYNIAGQLIIYTDTLVVGAFVSAAAVSYYAVAGRMVEYLRQIAIAILKYFMPLASSFEACSRYDRLEQLHQRGTQGVLLITYPIAAALLVRGGTFLRLWIGPDFSYNACPILHVLVIAAIVMLANCSTSGLALALDRHRTLAFITAAEGLANLALSLILVRRMGVLGVAVGTMIPAAATCLFFWPRYICGLLKMSTIHYIREAWLRPIIAVLPFAVVCHWADRYWVPTSLGGFVLQMIALAPVAVLGALMVFWSDAPAVWRYAFARGAVSTQ